MHSTTIVETTSRPARAQFTLASPLFRAILLGVLQGREGVQQACLAGQHRVQVSLNELRCADRDAEGN